MEDDFKPKRIRHTLNKNLLKDDFIKEISRRTGFSMIDIEKVLDTMREIFADAIDGGFTIKVNNFFHLYHKIIPARLGVNAYLSRIRKERVEQQYPPSQRTNLKLAKELREKSQIRIKELNKE